MPALLCAGGSGAAELRLGIGCAALAKAQVARDGDVVGVPGLHHVLQAAGLVCLAFLSDSMGCVSAI